MIITRIAKQERRDRYNIFVDGKFHAALSAELFSKSDLREGDELTPGQLEPLLERDEYGKILAKAYGFVSRRPHSRIELWLKLKRKEYSEPQIEEALDHLAELGYLDDMAFARQWVAERGRTRGPRLLRAELRQKQVSDEIIEQVLAAPEGDANTEIRSLAEKRLARLNGEPSDVRRRLTDYLLRRGYDFAAVREAVAESLLKKT